MPPFHILHNVSVHSCVPKYLEKYRAGFHQTFSIHAFWDRDERFKFWGQKVKVQGHSEIKYAGSSSLRSEVYGT